MRCPPAISNALFWFGVVSVGFIVFVASAWFLAWQVLQVDDPLDRRTRFDCSDLAEHEVHDVECHPHPTTTRPTISDTRVPAATSP